jgi:hypothetical protein
MTMRPEWHDWLLETGLPLVPHGGWTGLEEVALRATRQVERAIECNEEVNYLLGSTRRVRHVLVIAKLIALGHNPYHHKVGRVEWLGLIEREMASRREDTEQALIWALLRGYTRRAGPGYELTTLGQELVTGLTSPDE